MGGLYRISLFQNIHGQDVQNIFGYTGVGADTNCAELINVFVQQILPLIVAIQSSDVASFAIAVAEVVGNSEACIADLLNYDGERAGGSLPSFVAWAFQLLRTTGFTRSGAKRFAGVAEADQNDGQPEPAIQATLNALATELSFTYDVFGQDSTYVPVILQQNPNFWIANPISGSLFKRITSQNSRKLYTNSSLSITAGQETLGVIDGLSPPPALALTQTATSEYDLLAKLGANPPWQVDKIATVPSLVVL